MKRNEMIWALLAAALIVAVFWYRKRKATTSMQSGVGSTVGTTIAGAAAAPPAATIPITMNTGIIGPGASTLGGAAGPVDVVSGLGAGPPVTVPVLVSKQYLGYGGTPIYYKPVAALS